MKNQSSEKKSLVSIPEIKEYKNKYRLAAEEIYADLGVNNYSSIFNCMTRFRAVISDKKAVDLEKIKQIPLVKGIHWNGNELQIIIGGEVVKVVDEFNKYEQELLTPTTGKKQTGELQTKKSVGARILMAITGIMGPAIGLLMAAGIVSALYAILTIPDHAVLQTSVIGADQKPINIGMNNLHLFNLESGMMYILSKIILNSMGVFFIYNTARYFKGNTWFALAVGITLMCRGFWPDGVGAPLDKIHIGQWLSDVGPGKSGKSGWFLFQLGTYPIVVGGYEGAIIPYIVGGILVTYLDKWIKTWMPTTVDILFRSTLVYLISMFGLWFLLAPISSLIEFGLITAMNWFGKIPYGIGQGLVAMFWQPLVLTGAHVPVALGVNMELISGHSSAVGPAMGLGVFGQLGAVVGVGIITKNSNLRNIAIGAIPAGVFGITEPIIYGVNLPKLRPFLLGCLGGGIAGVLSGALGVTKNIPSGMGVFGILGFTQGTQQILFVLLSWAVAIGGSILLVVLFYAERKNEVSYFKKGIHKFIKVTNNDKTELNKAFAPYQDQIKAMKNDYKKISKYYSEISHCEQQMISLENKESKHREKMYQELIKLKTKLTKKNDQELLNKFNQLNEEYSTYSLEKEKTEVQSKLNKTTNTNQDFLNKFNQQKEAIYQNVYAKTSSYENKENKNSILAVQNIFWNALNSVEIGFGIEEPKPVLFKRKEK